MTDPNTAAVLLEVDDRAPKSGNFLSHVSQTCIGDNKEGLGILDQLPQP